MLRSIIILLMVGLVNSSFATDQTETETAKAVLLKDQNAGYKLDKRCELARVNGKNYKLCSYYLIEFNVLLAVKKSSSTEIEIIRLNNLTAPQSQGFSIYWNYTRHGDHKFKIYKPRGSTVLAVRRVMMTENGVTEVIHDSNHSRTQKVDPQKGMDFLLLTTEEANNELNSSVVQSRAFPGYLVTNVIPKDLSIWLGINENIGPFRPGSNSIAQLVSRVLSVLADQGNNAYNGVRSQKGALGFRQFMESSYREIASLYPEARLNPDFVSGMADHKNATKAVSILLDYHLSLLQKEQLQSVINSKHKLYQFLAASYNYGPYRTSQALKNDGTLLLDKLPNETREYLLMLERIREIIPKPTI